MPRKRVKPRRRSPKKKTAYAARLRDTERMLWIKTLPCCARNSLRYTPDELAVIDPGPCEIPDAGPCDGPVEADHAGTRGMSRKADDSTCIPLCVRHHREPGLAAILYGKLRPGQLRNWKDHMISRYQTFWEDFGEAHALGDR